VSSVVVVPVVFTVPSMLVSPADLKFTGTDQKYVSLYSVNCTHTHTHTHTHVNSSDLNISKRFLAMTEISRSKHHIRVTTTKNR
jgi:hypothetical protein